MFFSETKLKGAFVVDLDLKKDERGFFARSWCVNEFEKYNLDTKLVQCNVSFNHVKGTLRGMHYQAEPYPEAKLVRCTMGVIYDVVIDLRTDSPTFKEWIAVELSAENRRALYIPSGFAHGFQTLTDNCEVFYQMSEFFHPECSKGVRWNDPLFGIDWPFFEEVIISPRDMSYINFEG